MWEGQISQPFQITQHSEVFKVDFENQQKAIAEIRRSSLSMDDKRTLMGRLLNGASRAEISKAIETGKVTPARSASAPASSKGKLPSADDVYTKRRAESRAWDETIAKFGGDPQA